MPVIKDLITDMESTHWTKIRRVTPWLLPHGEPPEREYVVEPESMIDITQSMACIQCGACVSSCLSMEADPDFIGPAALAKAYRFVGDPRDAETVERLHDLAEDPHGIYDCTHCFSCIDACPKGVAPMDQIMRLRRKAGEHGIDDPNNGHNHEAAFVKIIEKKGTLDESLLLQESFAPGVKGKLKPTKGAIKGMLGSIPTALRGIRTGKMRSLPKLIPGVHPKLPDGAQDEVKAIYKHAEEHREEFNIYIKGEEDVEPSPTSTRGRREAAAATEARATAMKVAYWPGCVSRGFTTELHGSMALRRREARDRAGRTRPRQLLRRRRDRRAQPGARRHAQRPHLRPRPADRAGDDEHLLDLPGRPVGVPAAARRRLRLPRPHQRGAERPGARLREGQGRLHQQELPLAAGRGLRPRPASPSRSSGRSRACGSAPSTAATCVRPKERLGYDEYPDRDIYLEKVIEALGGEVVEYDGARKCCGFPVITMNRETSLRQAGTHVGDAIDAGADCLVTPCPLCHLNLDMQQPEAAKVVNRDLGLAVLHLPQLVGLALGAEPEAARA